MHKNELPLWLQRTWFIGREGDDDEDQNEDENEDGEEEEEEESEDTGSEDLSGLKKALEAERKAHREERKLRRKAEREARAAKQQKDDSEETKNLQETTEKLTASEEKTKRLANRLLAKERDDAILAEARRQGFIDPTDALTDDIRKAVEIDQDDEDPSDIEVDGDSVKIAVKALANQKKHLIGQPNEGEPSGGKFRKKTPGSEEKVGEDKLKEIYPSLR